MDALGKQFFSSASLTFQKNGEVRLGKNFSLFNYIYQTGADSFNVTEDVVGRQPAGLQRTQLGFQKAHSVYLLKRADGADDTLALMDGKSSGKVAGFINQEE